MPDAESEYFGESFDTDPPVPVGSPDVVANFATEDTAIPDDFVADEHVTDVGDLAVMRAGVECPRCESNVFLHPKSVYPPNTVYCFECSYSPFGAAWWETPRISSFVEKSD